MELTSLNASDKKSSKIIRAYVERAIEAAYKRVIIFPGFYLYVKVSRWCLVKLNMFLLVGKKYHRS